MDMETQEVAAGGEEGGAGGKGVSLWKGPRRDPRSDGNALCLGSGHVHILTDVSLQFQRTSPLAETEQWAHGSCCFVFRNCLAFYNHLRCKKFS